MHLLIVVFSFCFFKQKTAYDMRISDWSSDVCSSDLYVNRPSAASQGEPPMNPRFLAVIAAAVAIPVIALAQDPAAQGFGDAMEKMMDDMHIDRKRVVSGKSVSVRVDIGGRRILKKNNVKYHS